jgi:hypothetical protein
VDLASAQWHTRCGDDPAWAGPAFADPAFDDSAWATVEPRAPLPKEATPSPENMCWYRTQVMVNPALKNLGILIDRATLTDYELFVNGRREGGVGELPPHGKRFIRLMCVYSLSAPISSTGKLTIALRIWRYGRFGPMAALPGLPFAARLGLVPDLTLSVQNQILTQLAYGLIGGPVIDLMVGTLALGLFVGQRERKEYFWLAVYGVSFVCIYCVSMFAYSYPVSAIWSEASVLIFQGNYPLTSSNAL